MYTPRYARLDDRAELLAFMRAHSFATLVGVVDGAPWATHLPLLVREEADGALVLAGHLAKANPHAAALRAGGEALAVFAGPHAYVSPSLYAAPQNVPTWNYVAVHASGVPRVLDGAAALAGLEAMIAAYEPAFRAQWDGLPDRYRDGLLGGIVAFEVPVGRLEGKAKLSQNKPLAEQLRVAAALAASPDPAAADTGRRMTQRLETLPRPEEVPVDTAPRAR